MQKLSKRLFGSVHATTSSTTSCRPLPFVAGHSLFRLTMDKLMEEICKEKKIVDRCKKSIDLKEPYNLKKMKQQIDLSLSKITAMRMRLFHMQNSSFDARNPSTADLSQQILNAKLLCRGAQKVKESLIKDEPPNEKVLRETEQTILVLNEKLELLIQCSSLKPSAHTPISVRRSRDGFKRKHHFPVQVSGVLKIRVTGLDGLPDNTKPRSGRYASEYLFQMLKKKKKSVFGRHGLKRHHRGPVVNDYIVVIHVGGKEVATMVWNEKKTMVGGDEEVIQLFKSRQMDFEIYHTDSRSLCAIGSMQLESLLDEHDAESTFATFAHRVVNLMPEGSLHFQTTYSDPEQSMEKQLEENCPDGALRMSLSLRKNGSILARGSQTRYNPRSAISVNQFAPPSPFVKARTVDSLESYQLLSVIGVGAFGTVQLARRLDNGLHCAIKIIERDPKTKRFETPELEILQHIQHPFICSLTASFIEEDSLYLVLEFCEAGDLHTHLSRTANGFTKEQIMYFAATIVLAVEFLHKNLYVHRDLKTENMMLTRKGVLKIIDFGLCKKLSTRDEKMCDIVGTTTHLAAEIHRRELYGMEMDWWAVGVSLYQLRTREQPFYGTREVEMQKNSRVREWHTFNDLLSGLMAIHPEARLGYYSTDQVRKHPFFIETDFDALYNMRIPPPYVPLLKPGVDLEYFDNPYQSELDSSSFSYSTGNSLLNSDLTI